MIDATVLIQQAISASLSGDQPQAIFFNKQILKNDPHNIGALNRLGKSHFLLGQYNKAKVFYRKALTIDPYNNIAKRNLKLLTKTKAPPSKLSFDQPPSCYEFLEIPGKTQTVSLIRLANADRICQLKEGQLINLVFKKRTVQAYADNCYIGSLPDNIAARLVLLARKGNQYQSYIKGVQDNKITIFLKELKQGQRGKNIVSFPSTLQPPQYQTTIAKGLVR